MASLPAPDGQRARALVEQGLAAGVPAATLYLRVIAPAMLSTALPGHLLSVTRTCRLLRQLPRAPDVVVGGGAYRGDSARAPAVGADAFADDPQALLQLPADRSERDATQ